MTLGDRAGAFQMSKPKTAEHTVYYTVYALMIASASEPPEVRLSVHREELEAAKDELVVQGYVDGDGSDGDDSVGTAWIEEHELALWTTRTKGGAVAKRLRLSKPPLADEVDEQRAGLSSHDQKEKESA